MTSTGSIYKSCTLITVLLVFFGGCAKGSPTLAGTALEAIRLPANAERVSQIEELTLNDPLYLYANRSFFLPDNAMKTAATLKMLCRDNGFKLEPEYASPSSESIVCMKTSEPYISLEINYDCDTGCEVGLQLYHGYG